MAISGALNIIPSILDYETAPWYINNEELLFDSAYSRYWAFITQNTLAVTVAEQNVTKIAFCLANNADDNNKLLCVTDVNTTAHSFSAYGVGSQTSNNTINWETREWNIGRNYTFNVRDYSSYSIISAEITTNIPIFNTEIEAQNYINGITPISQAINYIPDDEEAAGEDFEITNIWTRGTWTPNGETNDGSRNYRSIRGRLLEGGKIATYDIPGIVDGKLKRGVIITPNFQGMRYTIDGLTWIPAQTWPFSYFYRERVKEYGTFDYALTYSTNTIPNFKDEETANGYIGGTVPISEATNWDDISPNYPDEDNGTGDPDDGTDWGEVYTRSFFSQQYLCGTGAIQEISNALYDISPGGLWEDIKKGLDMFGNNPMDAVISLMYYPLDLSTVFTNTSSTSSIWFGGYQFTMQSHTANKIVYPNGYFDCGNVSILPRFKNWRDILATRIFVDLPYCGRYELDPAKYMGKSINVIYYIDTHTGGCVACLNEGAAGSRYGQNLDQFNGQMGVSCPITLTDFSSYANAQINTLLGGGGQAVSGALSVGETGAHAVASGAGLSVAGAVGGAAALGAIQGAKTVYGLTMNNINKFNQTRGGSTGMLNQYVNQKPTFIFVYPNDSIPSNFYALNGGPSNAGGNVGNFSGYFEAEQIKLNMEGATQSEKEKARSLLMGGVYI